MQSRLLRSCVATLAVLGFFALAPRASADFINLEYKGNAGGTVDVTLNGTPLQSRLIGPFTWKDTNLTPNPAFNNPIKTFCIEIDKIVVPPFTPPTATFKITDPKDAPTLNASKFDVIKALYGKYYDFANDKVKTGTSDAAFQLALWEIIYDFGNIGDLDSGNFAANGGAFNNEAEGLLANLSGGLGKYNSSGYELVALVAPAGDGGKSQDEVQDHLTIRPKPVPAPAGLLLGGIGVLALVGRARWNRRPPAAA